MSLLFCAASFILMPWCSKPPSEIFKATETYGVHCYSKHFEVVSKTKHSNLENEAPKNSKTKTPKLETGLSFINWLESLLLIQQESSTITNRMQFKSTQVVGFCTLC